MFDFCFILKFMYLINKQLLKLIKKKMKIKKLECK